MLATGIVWDRDNNVKTIRLNNPGTERGKEQLYSFIKIDYPKIIGGEIFHPSSDPTMMLLTAPLNVHFIVTDPNGRRVGYDPTTGTSYSEIPGASYEIQSIDTPNEDGYTPQTLVAERYFVSGTDVPSGAYQVQVFAVNSGSYYLDYSGYDATGTTNKSIYHTGIIQVGQPVVYNFIHSDQAMPVPNAKINLKKYTVHNFHRSNLSKSDVKVSGKLIPNVSGAIKIGSGLVMALGGIGEYSLTIPSADFKIDREHGEVIYKYQNKDTQIKIKSNGEFKIELHRINLTNVSPELIGLVSVSIDNLNGQINSNLICSIHECSTKSEDKTDEGEE